MPGSSARGLQGSALEQQSLLQLSTAQPGAQPWGALPATRWVLCAWDVRAGSTVALSAVTGLGSVVAAFSWHIFSSPTQGPRLKGTSLAMKAFLQPGTQSLVRRQ